MQNKIEDIGMRPRRAAHGHAMEVGYAKQLIVAGNMMKRTFGSAMFLYGGKPTGYSSDAKLCRMLVFDNQVEDSCLANNDWGGIETWQGDAAYVCNNVVLRPHGYWHSLNQISNDNWKAFTKRWFAEYYHGVFPRLSAARAVSGMWSRSERNAASAGFAYAFYYGGASKQCLFNDIGVGRSSGLNSALLTTGAVRAVGGCFLLNTFNNIFYKFGTGYQRQGTHPGTDVFLGNVFESIGEIFFHLGAPKKNFQSKGAIRVGADKELGRDGAKSSSLLWAFPQNILPGTPKYFGVIEKSGYIRKGMVDWKRALNATSNDTGVYTAEGVLRDPENQDHRLKSGYKMSERTFVPWALLATVGEWQFRFLENEPHRIIDDHWYTDSAHKERGMYRGIQCHHFHGENITVKIFIEGPTDNWIKSAVILNG